MRVPKAGGTGGRPGAAERLRGPARVPPGGGSRRDDARRATPILVLTTESDAEKKQRARAAGATGWIVKPFDPVKLVDAVRRVAA